MPYLQFVKDRRGYEQTCVMHAYRRRGKAKAAILYLYRTPPNIRVGRPALDPEAIRALEAGHPELQFDWDRMLKDRAAEPAPRAFRPGGDRDSGRRTAPPRRPRAEQARVATRADDGARVDARDPAGATEVTEQPEALEPVSVLAAAAPDTVSPEELGPPESMAGAEDDGRLAAGAPAADTLLGRESLARYRARYAELVARIAERVPDPARREVLRRDAERLDPDTWVTAEEAERGIRGFDAAVEAIRAQIGRRRRSRRGGARRRGRPRSPSGLAADSMPPPTAEPESGADVQIAPEPERAAPAESDTEPE